MANVSLLGQGVSSPVSAPAASLASPLAQTAKLTDVQWVLDSLAARLTNMMAAAHWLFVYNPGVPLYDSSVKRAGACLYTGPEGMPWNSEGRNFQAGSPLNGIVASDRIFSVTNYMSDAAPASTIDGGGVQLTRCWEYERLGYYGEDFMVPMAALNGTGYTTNLVSFWAAMQSIPVLLSAESDLAEQFAKAALRGPALYASKGQALLGIANQAKAMSNQLAGRRANMLPIPMVGRKLFSGAANAAVAETIEATTKVAASLR